MRDKERLLDQSEPLRFIFSPTPRFEKAGTLNVFQDLHAQRVAIGGQEAARRSVSLRLPVNAAGERVHDETVNRLTVIANESYEDFAHSSTEFEEDFGIQFGKVETTASLSWCEAEDGSAIPLVRILRRASGPTWWRMAT